MPFSRVPVQTCLTSDAQASKTKLTDVKVAGKQIL